MNNSGILVDTQLNNPVAIHPQTAHRKHGLRTLSYLFPSYPSFARSSLHPFNAAFHSLFAQNNSGSVICSTPFHTAYYYYYCFIYKERNIEL